MMEMWQWESLRPKLLGTLYNVMQAELPRLWSPRKPEESFCSLFIQTAVCNLCVCVWKRVAHIRIHRLCAQMLLADMSFEQYMACMHSFCVPIYRMCPDHDVRVVYTCMYMHV
jgi:hypothetical protein